MSSALIDDSGFPGCETLAEWRRTARARRAAGTPSHDAYVASLRDRLSSWGLTDVRLEALPVGDGLAHNLVALLPGASDELVVLHAHSDSDSAPHPETDNGPEAVLGIVHYLAALPRESRPRGFLVLLSSGRTCHEEIDGVEVFLDRHAEDLVPRIATTLTFEGYSPDGVELRGQVVRYTAEVLEVAAASWTKLRGGLGLVS